MRLVELEIIPGFDPTKEEVPEKRKIFVNPSAVCYLSGTQIPTNIVESTGVPVTKEGTAVVLPGGDALIVDKSMLETVALIQDSGDFVYLPLTDGEVEETKNETEPPADNKKRVRQGSKTK